MSWNKKNQQFALVCGLRPSTINLAQYLLRRVDKYKPTEILLDLREWNKEIGKTRPKGEYDRKTAKEANTQLNELTYGWFTIVKSYTWAVHKVLVRPVEYALNKKSQLSGIAPKPKRGNPMFSEEHKNKARELLLQKISKLDSLLKKFGMKCNLETLHRMWTYADRSMENVASAVKYMLRVNQEKIERSTSFENKGKGLDNPIGWLHDCLKHGRHLDCDENVTLPPLHQFDSIMQLVRDCNQLRYQT